MIDFTLTPAQQNLRVQAQTFASQVLSTVSSNYTTLTTQSARFRSLKPFYQTAVQNGLLKSQIPVALGGTNESFLDAAIFLEETFAADSSCTSTIIGTALGLMPLIMSGNERLQKKYLPIFLSGEGEPLASLMHSEPGGTANWLQKGGKGLQAVARKEGVEWVVNGEKLWTTNSGGWDGKGADLACLVCRKSTAAANGNAEVNGHGAKDDPASSIIVFLVDRDTVASQPDAYGILDEPELMGLPATSGPHTRFTNFRVSQENVLVEGTAAAELVVQAFTATAGMVGALSVSIMRAAFEAALQFAKDDSRGGSVPIIEHQSVANLLMDVKMRTDAARLVTWKALHVLENGPGDFANRQELCLQAKIYCSDNCVKAVTDAMSAVGMTSYRKDQPFSRLLNDAMCLPLFDGGNIGVRRRQMESIFKREEYEPWAGTFR